MAALGVQPPDVEPRATEHIPEMVEMIAKLVDKGFAYEADGHVLFNVTGPMATTENRCRSAAFAR